MRLDQRLVNQMLVFLGLESRKRQATFGHGNDAHLEGSRNGSVRQTKDENIFQEGLFEHMTRFKDPLTSVRLNATVLFEVWFNKRPFSPLWGTLTNRLSTLREPIRRHCQKGKKKNLNKKDELCNSEGSRFALCLVLKKMDSPTLAFSSSNQALCKNQLPLFLSAVKRRRQPSLTLGRRTRLLG